LEKAWQSNQVLHKQIAITRLPSLQKAKELKLTEEKAFILYKDILMEIEPTKSVKDIAKAVNRKSIKRIWGLLGDMEKINLIKRVIDEPKCVRYEKTARGEKICNAKSLDEIRKR
jgi:predicted MarR family transcription regulator